MDISRETLQYLRYHPLSSRDEIASGTSFDRSDATMKHHYICRAEWRCCSWGQNSCNSLSSFRSGSSIDASQFGHILCSWRRWATDTDPIQLWIDSWSTSVRNTFHRWRKDTFGFTAGLVSSARQRNDRKRVSQRNGVSENWSQLDITGTNYHPLDNEFQIREAMHDTCDLINSKENIFDKALLTLILLSYIQAFSDGNKRTARITSNAILIANGYCPLSFRTVDSIDYKKAMLIFCKTLCFFVRYWGLRTRTQR